jgi:hypothetical protein
MRCCCHALLLPSALAAEPGAGGRAQTVTVTCRDFAADFAVKLTASASSPGDVTCQASDDATANVNVNTQPAVSIKDVSEATSFCSPDAPLVFTYNVSSGAANSDVDVLLEADSAAGCRLSSSTGRLYMLFVLACRVPSIKTQVMPCHDANSTALPVMPLSMPTSWQQPSSTGRRALSCCHGLAPCGRVVPQLMIARQSNIILIM